MVAVDDDELKVLRHPIPFMAAASALPVLAAWVDADVAEPISDVLPMGRIRNVYRPLTDDGTALVDGYRPIGDAWVHTNATFAFGASLALIQAFSLAALADEHDDLSETNAAFEAAHAEDARQRWTSVTAEDRDRARWWAGAAIDPLDPASSMPLFLRHVVYPAASRDPDIFRKVARRIDAVDPIDALEADSALLDRARHIHHALVAGGQLAPTGRPDRGELHAIIEANHESRGLAPTR